MNLEMSEDKRGPKFIWRLDTRSIIISKAKRIAT